MYDVQCKKYDGYMLGVTYILAYIKVTDRDT